MDNVGPFKRNRVTRGDCREMIAKLPDESVDVLITSPPYWGQRISEGTGVEADPRDFVESLVSIFAQALPKLKEQGVLWVNLGDSYNTPVNWRSDDLVHSTLGHEKTGLDPENTAYTKPRGSRRAFIDPDVPWLTYGNLLGLTYRMVLGLCDEGYLFRGEVIWSKRNPMPEGRCRRPHRAHESIYLLSRSERHQFRVSPPVKSVWEFANDKPGDGPKHFSRFPEELPARCIDAYGLTGEDVVVLDPFSGSGTTGLAALNAGCSYVGFEIDSDQARASNKRLGALERRLGCE